MELTGLLPMGTVIVFVFVGIVFRMYSQTKSVLHTYPRCQGYKRFNKPYNILHFNDKANTKKEIIIIAQNNFPLTYDENTQQLVTRITDDEKCRWILKPNNKRTVKHVASQYKKSKLPIQSNHNDNLHQDIRNYKLHGPNSSSTNHDQDEIELKVNSNNRDFVIHYDHDTDHDDGKENSIQIDYGDPEEEKDKDKDKDQKVNSINNNNNKNEENRNNIDIMKAADNKRQTTQDGLSSYHYSYVRLQLVHLRQNQTSDHEWMPQLRLQFKSQGVSRNNRNGNSNINETRSKSRPITAQLSLNKLLCTPSLEKHALWIEKNINSDKDSPNSNSFKIAVYCRLQLNSNINDKKAEYYINDLTKYYLFVTNNGTIALSAEIIDSEKCNFYAFEMANKDTDAGQTKRNKKTTKLDTGLSILKRYVLICSCCNCSLARKIFKMFQLLTVVSPTLDLVTDIWTIILYFSDVDFAVYGWVSMIILIFSNRVYFYTWYAVDKMGIKLNLRYHDISIFQIIASSLVPIIGYDWFILQSIDVFIPRDYRAKNAFYKCNCIGKQYAISSNCMVLCHGIVNLMIWFAFPISLVFLLRDRSFISILYIIFWAIVYASIVIILGYWKGSDGMVAAGDIVLMPLFCVYLIMKNNILEVKLRFKEVNYMIRHCNEPLESSTSSRNNALDGNDRRSMIVLQLLKSIVAIFESFPQLSLQCYVYFVVRSQNISEKNLSSSSLIAIQFYVSVGFSLRSVLVALYRLLTKNLFSRGLADSFNILVGYSSAVSVAAAMSGIVGISGESALVNGIKSTFDSVDLRPNNVVLSWRK